MMRWADVADRAREGVRETVVDRWAIVRQLPRMGPGTLAVLVVTNLLLGVLPLAFVLLTSRLVDLAPIGATGDGGKDPTQHDLVTTFLLMAGVFTLEQCLLPLRAAFDERARRAVDRCVHDRILTAALHGDGLAAIERAPAREALAEATRWLRVGHQSPGTACAGMLALLARYLRLSGYVAVLAVQASPLTAGLVAVAVLALRNGQRGGIRRYARVWGRIIPRLREGDYLREVLLGKRTAKELRVFGAADWFGERYARNYRLWTAEVWRRRRQVYLYPFLLLTAAAATVFAAAAATLVDGAVAGGTGAADLALGLQALAGAAFLADQYPECDLQTAHGMLAATATARLERAMGMTPTATEDAGGQGVTGSGRRSVPGSADAAPVRADVRADVPADAVPDPGAVSAASLHFRGVVFGYPGTQRRVLDGFDLQLPAGRCTALVGVNGAGKSTAVKLLAGLYRPDGGEIVVGGRPLQDLPPAWWRSRVAVVFQDFLRLELSALANITLGSPGPVDVEAARRAAERAGVLQALEQLPDGLVSPLSAGYRGGSDLSGGQWQRLAIARAFYAVERGAQVLVLDEPTAALDVAAESEFHERFVERTRGVTSVLVSHRFSTVRRADLIAVLDAGRVVEHGTHEDLVDRGGLYAQMFRTQAARFAADGAIPRPGERRVVGSA